MGPSISTYVVVGSRFIRDHITLIMQCYFRTFLLLANYVKTARYMNYMSARSFFFHHMSVFQSEGKSVFFMVFCFTSTFYRHLKHFNITIIVYIKIICICYIVGFYIQKSKCYNLRLLEQCSMWNDHRYMYMLEINNQVSKGFLKKAVN